MRDEKQKRACWVVIDHECRQQQAEYMREQEIVRKRVCVQQAIMREGDGMKGVGNREF